MPQNKFGSNQIFLSTQQINIYFRKVSSIAYDIKTNLRFQLTQ